MHVCAHASAHNGRVILAPVCHAASCSTPVVWSVRRALKAEVSAAALHRPQVEQWVDRELQGLLLDSDVSVVAQHIQGSISAAFPQVKKRCVSNHVSPPLLPFHYLAFALLQHAEALLGLSCPSGPDASLACCDAVRSQRPTCCLPCAIALLHLSGSLWPELAPDVAILHH